MANTGHILSVPGYPLARIENNISVNIRDGFLKIVGGQPGTLPRALPPAGTRTAVSPTWYPVSRVGRNVRSGLDFWYENLILDPTEKNCHTIIATLEYAIIIWNSSALTRCLCHRAHMLGVHRRHYTQHAHVSAARA